MPTTTTAVCTNNTGGYKLRMKEVSCYVAVRPFCEVFNFSCKIALFASVYVVLEEFEIVTRETGERCGQRGRTENAARQRRIGEREDGTDDPPILSTENLQHRLRRRFSH